MIYKIIGSVLILLACAGVGFQYAAAYLREERSVKQLIYCLDYMECELQYRLTPLAELCHQVSEISSGEVSRIFLCLAEEVENQTAPRIEACMRLAIQKTADVPAKIYDLFLTLGQTLGRFDLHGQVKGIEGVRQECRNYLESLTKNKEVRVRGYQTLGICAGAALVILFI